jgi:hypothetical protein
MQMHAAVLLIVSFELLIVVCVLALSWRVTAVALPFCSFLNSCFYLCMFQGYHKIQCPSVLLFAGAISLSLMFNVQSYSQRSPADERVCIQWHTALSSLVILLPLYHLSFALPGLEVTAYTRLASKPLMLNFIFCTFTLFSLAHSRRSSAFDPLLERLCSAACCSRAC